MTHQQKKLKANIDKQVEKLKSSPLLSADHNDNSLFHLFNQRKVTPEQKHDVMNFRNMGEMEFEGGSSIILYAIPV